MAFENVSVGKAREAADRLLTRVNNMRMKGEQLTGTVIRGVEVVGSASAWGYANNRWGTNGELDLLGVPADLGAGFLAFAAGLLGVAGKYSEHVANIGIGSLASYGTRAAGHLGAQANAPATHTGYLPRPAGYGRDYFAHNARQAQHAGK